MGMGSLGAFNPERFNLNFRGLKAKAKKDGVARLAQSKPFRVSVCAARTLNTTGPSRVYALSSKST